MSKSGNAIAVLLHAQ